MPARPVRRQSEPKEMKVVKSVPNLSTVSEYNQRTDDQPNANGDQNSTFIKTPLLQNDKKTLNFRRFTYNLQQFNEQFEAVKDGKSFSHFIDEGIGKIFHRCSAKHFGRKLAELVPIIGWLGGYQWREDFLSDIMSGLTILVFQIPQSMGYSMIARVEPVHGLYSSFFPPLIYALLGTSRHCAVGTFAVVSLMTGSLVTHVLESYPPDVVPPSTISLVTCISFLVGLYQLIFGIFRLGFFSNYMSEQLVSGFTTAASIYVFTSQIPYLFGLHLNYRSGPLSLFYAYRDLFDNLGHTHLPTLVVSLTGCLILIVFKFLITPFIQRKTGCNVPVPIELILVSIGTVISGFIDLKNGWGVQVVGELAQGLPSPALPDFGLVRRLALSCVPLAVVAYTLTISVGKIFATRYKYELDSNQELLALGTTNIVGCFFLCLPSAASLSRSAVQVSSGGRTQLVSLVNCVGLLIFLQFGGSLLRLLPICLLAAIIVVALKTLLLQVKDFCVYWRVSKLDASIWVITFVATLVCDVDIGLYVSLGYSLLTLIYKSQRPRIYMLGCVNNTEVFVPIKRYASAAEVAGVKIYQFCGPLHFANIEYFRKELAKKTGINVRELEKRNNKLKRKCVNNNTINLNELGVVVSPEETLITHIIIDCSMFSYIDVAGVRQLKASIQEYENVGIKTFLACVATHVHEMLEKDEFFIHIPPHHVYITIHDAIHHALDDQRTSVKSESADSGTNGGLTFTIDP